MHLIIDGYSDNEMVLQDEGHLHRWLENYPAAIGMNRISPPYVLRYVGPDSKDWGISGFVFIAESHISIHTFVERCYVNIDVFSCKDFDTDRAIRDLSNRLKLTGMRTYLLDRDGKDLSQGREDKIVFTRP